MRTNLLYLILIASLAAGGIYIVRQEQPNWPFANTAEPTAAELRAARAAIMIHPPVIEKPIDVALGTTTIEEPAVEHTAAERAAAHRVFMIGEEVVQIGQSRDTIEAKLGGPAVVSANGNHWTYDDRVIIFRDDFVSGWLELDERAIELHRNAVVSGSLVNNTRVIHAWKFIDLDESGTGAASRSSSFERTYTLRDRLVKQRSHRNSSFRQPDFLQAFRRTLDRNRQLSERARQQNSNRNRNSTGGAYSQRYSHSR
ncbi:MAG: hypothetical protein ACR2GY_07400 [Phycisphaerales bacterium]